jgi:integrase
MFDEFKFDQSGKSSFIDFIRDEINKRYQVGEIRKATYSNHMTFVSTLEDFGKIRKFSDLTLKKIVEFDRYVRTRKNVSLQSTVWAYHKRMKIYVYLAIKRGHLKMEENPYLNFQVEKGKQGDRKYLNREELQAIEKLELKIARLARVRDMFVFCCYTGLAFNDPERLSGEHLVTADGYTFLKMYTFATTISLLNGIPLEVLRKMLGHASISTTQIYARVLDQRIASEMSKLVDRLGNNS